MNLTWFSGFFGLVIVSLFEAVVNALFVEATKTLPVLLLSLLFQALIAFLFKIEGLLQRLKKDEVPK